jgi:cystathionine gamma-lyase/cystathionine gamma-lyase/homocysteine desulfhydrase
MHSTTKALHCRVDARDALPSVTPLYQSSAFESGSPYFYTRKNNPNVAEFENVIATLENCRHAVGVSTGMAAIAAVLELLEPGGTLVVNKHIYGCSYKLFQRVCARLRAHLHILDLAEPDEIERIPANTRIVIFETPTNPFLKTVDIASVAQAARERSGNAIVVVDNTWATPLFQHPLECGADISLHSATKYFSGHSDVMAGVLLTDRDDLYEHLQAVRFYQGAILEPHSAWLLRRSMQTFAVRLQAHYTAAHEIAGFLSTLPQVSRVYYPQIDGRQLKGYGALIFFDLREDLVSRYKEFTGALQLFGTGTGMACVTSMVAQPYRGSHASMTPEEKAGMGLDERLIRLSIGLEHPQDLKEDLRAAFSVIEAYSEQPMRVAV